MEVASWYPFQKNGLMQIILIKVVKWRLETGQDSISISANKETATHQRTCNFSYPLPKEENIVANITGAYLLGYDVIQINSKSIIPGEDQRTNS